MGTMQHNLAVKDTTLATPMIDANGSADLHLGGLSAGTYQIYCILHSPMRGTFTVGS